MTSGKRRRRQEGSGGTVGEHGPRQSDSPSAEVDSAEEEPPFEELAQGGSVAHEELESLRLRPEFWNGVLRVAGTEPRTAREIGGASGVRHSALAIGVDDVEKRLIVISAEGQAYGAALAQADIQSATPDYKVIVVRPVVVSVGSVASAITEAIGSSRMSFKSLGWLGARSKEQTYAIFEQYMTGPFELVERAIRNAQSVGSPGVLQVVKQVIDQLAPLRFESDEEDLTVDLAQVTASRGASLDTQLGICGFPLSEMSDGDLDVFLDHRDLDSAREILRRYAVYQFFFPSPDQLLLGAIDRRAAISKAQQPSEIAESLGHPAGAMELVPADTQLTDLVDALIDRKMLVQGEVSVELTEEGMRQRASVKFMPREGTLSKIVNRISVNLDLKQIFGVQIGSSAKQPNRQEHSASSE